MATHTQVSLYAAAALPVFIWLYLLLAHGRFWRAGQLPAAAPDVKDTAYRVVAVIPARDEATVIADTVNSLLTQDYGAPLHVIVVDDGSSDGTAGVAARAAAALGASERLTLLNGAALPTGWTGKVWAMSQGAAAAVALAPDFLLFTDADIHHDPEHVAALVAQAKRHGYDLVSTMVELPVRTLAEQCLIPAFVFFFQLLYPPRWIASERERTAAAAGGCMLVRPQALARAGGLQSIRSQLIDDCALARAVKGAGGTLWLGLTHTARSTRSYDTFGQIARMISRSAFNQLRHSYVLLAATIAGLGITYLGAPLLLLSGDPLVSALGASAWILMSIAYAPMVRFYRLNPLWSLCLPAIAVFYAGATLHSALQYRLRRGGLWKGRVQDRRL